MIAQPDARAFRAFLERAARRLTWMFAGEGAAAGLAVAAAIAFLGWPRPGAVSLSIAAGLSFAAAGVVLRLVASRANRRRIAHLVERRAPQSRNLIVTASELGERHGERHGEKRGDQSGVADHIAALVYAQATRLVSGLDLSSLFPARNTVLALAAGGALWTASFARSIAPGAVHAARESRAITEAVVNGIDVLVTPPDYAKRQPQTRRDPARIEALAGSRIRLTIRAHATSVLLETLHSRDSVAGAETFVGNVIADADGYIAVEPRSSAGVVGPRRLIGLSVTPDVPPRVRITAPAKDLFLRDAHETIELGIEAGDDIGLASLKLRYTKVSGSGERFTFTEGELPITVARPTDRAWTARATWNLETLGLEPGDMVVYRAVASDHRPGAAPSESDSYIAEILLPGGNAAPGFSVDPEQERYAVSQQMVIVKTERLAARKAQMTPDAYADAAAELAAEQRKVRAEFVFMMGGELGEAPDPNASMTDINEEEEAVGEADLLAGRNINQGRVALLRAIRSMSRAASSLTTADLPTALPHERAALTQLERAFSHTRILLRALTEHERLDLTRRLTGTLTDAAGTTRPSADPEANPRIRELRRSLAGVAAIAGSRTLDVPSAARASALAEAVLRVDPSSKALQDIATLLTTAAGDITRGRVDDARRDLNRAATAIAGTLRADLLPAPTNASSIDLDRLSGALSDALRRPRGSP